MGQYSTLILTTNMVVEQEYNRAIELRVQGSEERKARDTEGMIKKKKDKYIPGYERDGGGGIPSVSLEEEIVRIVLISEGRS